MFITVSDPSTKVSIKESIERQVFLLHNFIVFKIDGLGGDVRGGGSGHVVIGWSYILKCLRQCFKRCFGFMFDLGIFLRTK